MKVISKDKAKGAAHGTMKKMKKRNRLVEEKEVAKRTENKRINAENRKVREEKKQELEKVSQVKILDYIKGMLIVEVDNKVEKRALLFEKKDVNKRNLKDKLPTFEVKLYGENYQISKLNGFLDVMDDLLWKLEETL
ncbi:MAG: hypothetical protein ACRCXY_06915 [Fusobacteriaceae bacterium]